MKDALKEIGFRRAIRYLFGVLQSSILSCTLLLPPFRVAILRLFGCKIGSQSVVHPCTFINLYRSGLRGLKFGHHCFIGEQCLFDLADRIECGDHVTFAERVMVLTHRNIGFRDHPLQRHLPPTQAPVIVGSGVFIGAQALILAGVKIGDGAVVGAGSVVLDDVQPHTVVAGVPAKVIRSLPADIPAA